MPSSVIYIYKLAPSLEPSLILSPCPLYQYRFSLPDPPFLSTAITNNIVFQVFFTLGLMQTPTRPPIQSTPSLTSICPARLWASFPQLPPPAIKTQTPWFDFQSSPPPAFCLSPAAPFLQLKGSICPVLKHLMDLPNRDCLLWFPVPDTGLILPILQGSP